jgi:hypothetical protein
MGDFLISGKSGLFPEVIRNRDFYINRASDEPVKYPDTLKKLKSRMPTNP